MCDDLDQCLGSDGSGDNDGDGWCDDADPDDDDDGCPDGQDANRLTYSPDIDGDGTAFDCDVCIGDDASGNSDNDLFCDDLDVDVDGDGCFNEDDAAPADPTPGTWYADTDGDGFGDALLLTFDCSQPVGFVPDGSDCNDADDTVFPGQTEVVGAGEDRGCDGLVACANDVDGDGFGGAAFTLLPTTVGGSFDCSAVSGLASNTADCNDGDLAVNPGATEVVDDVDNDCSGVLLCWTDGDGDGHGGGTPATTQAASCAQGGHSTLGDDCDDGDDAAYPGADEVVADGVDQDCDAGDTCYVDADDDGDRPDTTSLVASVDLDCVDSGEAEGTDPAGDCNDASAAQSSLLSEICSNGLDDDCTPATPDLFDGDGDSITCSADCDDADPNRSPLIVEDCANGIDDDCDADVDLADFECDQDGDGVVAAVDNCPFEANATQEDTDGDGDGDVCDEDDDDDGLSDVLEIFVVGTDPLLMDTDDDGIVDPIEAILSPTSPILSDTDGDGVCDGPGTGFGTCTPAP